VLQGVAMRMLVMVCLVGCGASPSDDLLPAPDPDDGVQIAYAIDVLPGTEAWKCNVLDLPSDKWMSVNHVESVQNAAMHHMDLMAIALAAPELPPGEYDCADVYAQYPRLMDDGIIVYASQQAQQQITLPPGTVAELLPKMRVMHEIHFVNPTEEVATAYSKINAYKYPDDKVTQQIWGGAVRDLDIAVPPGAQSHVEWTRCVMNKDVDVLFLSTHTHQLARRAEIRLFDGTTTGERIYENLDWHAPPLEDYTAQPLHVPAGHGFEFACHYANPTDREVRWGFEAKDEMCQIALVFTPGETARKCEIVEHGVR
jgi:hypothetical protein